MKNSYYKSIIAESPNAYASHIVVCDHMDSPLDFKCLEVNAAFEEITGLKTPEIIGNRITDMIPNMNKSPHNWLAEFGKIALTGGTWEFELCSQALKLPYRIKVFSPQKYYFVTIFSVVSEYEERLCLSEQRCKMLVDNMAENLWAIDLNNNFTYISPSVHNVLGYTFEEVLAMRPEQIFTEKCFWQMMDLFQAALEADKAEDRDPERSWVIEAESMRKDGTKNWTKSTIRILRDHNSEPIGFLGVSHDVTEERKAKEALVRSEENLRLILNSAAGAIYGVDLKGNCTFCNPSCLKLLGYEYEQELLGKNIHQLAHYKYPNGRHFPQNECPICHAIVEGVPLHLDNIVFWRSDGNGFSAELFVHPQYRDNTLVGAVVTFIDITERKKMQQELEESERIKEILLANLPGMAYKVNYGPKLLLEYISDGCFNLTGYTPETIQQNVNSFFVKPDPQIECIEVGRIQNRIAEAVIGKSEYKDEYPIKTASGKKKWVLDQGKGIYNEAGELLALEGLIIDITDRKLKEEENLFLTYHDTLTGLYNRFYYQQAVNSCDRRAFLPLSVIFGDINGLKLINDAFGHDMGDSLIQDAAKILRSCCREHDVVARTGGDEFCILLPRTDSITAAKRIQLIQKCCAEFNNELKERAYTVDIALGFATKTKPSEDLNYIIKMAEDNMYKHKLLEHNSSRSMIVSSIKKALLERTYETEEHAERLILLARQLGNKLGLSQMELDDLLLLATLHDIGEVGIEERILHKPCKLLNEEWEEIQKHPEIGYRIAMSCQEFSSIADFILSHQERWDGKGYPRGLAGENIPLLSRIIAIVDAYDAMTQDRPYRRALSRGEAISEIRNNSGTQFDPNIAPVFLELLKDNPHL